jgi:hypothetical protein
VPPSHIPQTGPVALCAAPAAILPALPRLHLVAALPAAVRLALPVLPFLSRLVLLLPRLQINLVELALQLLELLLFGCALLEQDVILANELINAHAHKLHLLSVSVGLERVDSPAYLCQCLVHLPQLLSLCLELRKQLGLNLLEVLLKIARLQPLPQYVVLVRFFCVLELKLPGKLGQLVRLSK